MRRFFVEEINPQEKVCSLIGQEARHIYKVLRLRAGDSLILSDRQGRHFQARIEKISRQQVQVILEKPLPAPVASPLNLTICQSILKPRAMDLLVEKITELGATRLMPFISDRTAFKLEDSQAKAKMHHWQAISQSATKQCERSTPLEIEPIRTLENMLETAKTEEGFKMILWEAEESREIKSLLKASVPPVRFLGMVGPEGGFSEKEIAWTQTAGFHVVSLGQRILRAETAAIALTALVQYEWGDLGHINTDLKLQSLHYGSRLKVSV